MNGMFAKARSFNQDLSNWEVSDETNVDEIFKDATSLKEDYKPVLPDLSELPKELTDEQYRFLYDMYKVLGNEEANKWVDELGWFDDK
jgi:hypothetical protein